METTSILQLSEKDLREILADEVQRAVDAAFAKAAERKKERENPQYYTRDEVCKLLHISSVTFHCWVAQGRIQTVKAGRRTLVDREDLQKRISSGEIGRYQHARK